jgi:hypothetical protein
MTHENDKTMKDALRIATILNNHLTNGECNHCKNLFKEIFD